MTDPTVLLTTHQDCSGLIRSRVFPADRDKAVFESGISIGRASGLLLTHDDGVAIVEGVDPLAGDLRGIGDRDHVAILDSASGLAWTPLTLTERDGTPASACPRATLQRMIARAHTDFGLEFVTGVELEFTLLRAEPTGDSGFAFAHDGPAYGARAVIDLEPFVMELLSNLRTAEVPIDCVHPEYAKGQFEVVLSPQNPLRTADSVVLTKLIIDRTARSHGLRPSFAPLLDASMAGNGCHTHLSARNHLGNVFSDPAAPHMMTETAQNIVAGILELLPEGVALLAGNTTSYSRLSPGRWAGAMAAWGVRNREASLRVLPAETAADADSANVELKTPDPLSNHYLVAAFMIGAGLFGIEQGLRLPDPAVGDPALLDEKQRANHRARPFAPDLRAALDLLQRSTTLRSILGDDLIDVYAAVRGAEWDAHHEQSVSDQISAVLFRY